VEDGADYEIEVWRDAFAVDLSTFAP